MQEQQQDTSAPSSVKTPTAQIVAWVREQGWSPVPLAGKNPGINGKDWWGRAVQGATDLVFRDGQNVGVCTGTALPDGGFLWVVDPDGDEGLAEWNEICVRKFYTPNTFTVRTGGGGLHLYYRTERPMGGGDISKKINGRGVGGQVVSVGSIHPDTGRQYVHEHGFAQQLETAPEWLVGMVSQHRKTTTVSWTGEQVTVTAEMCLAHADAGIREIGAGVAIPKDEHRRNLWYRDASRLLVQVFTPGITDASVQDLLAPTTRNDPAECAELGRWLATNRANYGLSAEETATLTAIKAVAGHQLTRGDTERLWRESRGADRAALKRLALVDPTPLNVEDVPAVVAAVHRAHPDVSLSSLQAHMVGIAGDVVAASLEARRAIAAATAASVAHLPPEARELTEAGLAYRFRVEYEQQVIYVMGQGWRRWDVAGYWAPSGRPTDVVHAMLVRLEAECQDEEIAGYFRTVRSAKAINAIVSLCEGRTPFTFRTLDRDAWLLNCRNGTLDMRTGVLRAHAPTDLITQQTATIYDPAATCPNWDAFMQFVTCGDAELERQLQWTFGRALIGEVRSELLIMLSGGGANGKSTMLRTIGDLLGSYSGELPASAFLGGHTSAVGRLAGRRFVRTSEISNKVPLNWAVLKSITSYETLSVQTGMGRDFVDLRASWLTVAPINGMPRITEANNSELRRLRVLPFEAVINTEAGVRVRYDQELIREAPGILNWLIRGFLMGEQEPRCRREREATAEVFEVNDPLTEWIEGCCVLDPGAVTPLGDLWNSYSSWSGGIGRAAGDRLHTRRGFSEALNSRGFRSNKGTNGVREKIGIRVRIVDGSKYMN